MTRADVRSALKQLPFPLSISDSSSRHLLLGHSNLDPNPVTAPRSVLAPRNGGFGYRHSTTCPPVVKKETQTNKVLRECTEGEQPSYGPGQTQLWRIAHARWKPH